MRPIDRIDLVGRIGRQLQARMSISDINHFLENFGVDLSKKTSSVNSKWVYVKDRLAGEPDKTILQIADELEIDHGFASSSGRDLSDSPFWLAGYFRLFLSHVSSFKKTTAALQKALRSYGISAFVAHEDIEPTREWQDEIEKALLSMDALAAILTPDFHESKWTDQEIGVAIGRELLVIPIRHGLDPYGFIGKYQGFQPVDRSVAQVADAIFKILSNNEKSRGTLAEKLLSLFQLSNRPEEMTDWLRLLDRFPSIPGRHLERIHRNTPAGGALAKNSALLEQVNDLLMKHSLPPVSIGESLDVEAHDDIPF